VNNSGFEVERRTDHWQKIGFVDGHGTTNAPQNYAYLDQPPAGEYAYRLRQIDRDGAFRYSNVVEVEVTSVPKAFGLDQNYPNPFNPTTTVAYSVPAESFVTIKVYDVLGKEVASLVSERQKEGHYETSFDGSRLSSGVYVCRMTAAARFSVTKMMIAK
jgi:hypothetical protein